MDARADRTDELVERLLTAMLDERDVPGGARRVAGLLRAVAARAPGQTPYGEATTVAAMVEILRAPTAAAPAVRYRPATLVDAIAWRSLQPKT